MPSTNTMSTILAGLALLGVTSAVPTGSKALATRQNEDSLYTCRDAGCTDCPLYFSTGSGGWPECPYYSGSQLTDNGFPPDANGKIRIWIDVPEQDYDCRALIRTPIRPNDVNCGANVFVAEGATCSPIVIDNTFIASFCCGQDDCTDAGAPWKRDTSKPRGFNNAPASGDLLALYDNNGNMIEPQVAARIQGRSEADIEAPVQPKPRSEVTQGEFDRLTKRDCDEFEVTRGPFTSGGQQYIISEVVTCGPTEGCSAKISKTVTEETSFSVEVSVSDPLGIVSASVGFEYSKSVSQTFEGSWDFGPGERGYLTFIPYLTCVEGYFKGDCSDDGEITQVCGGQYSGDDESTIRGEKRPVLIRG